MTPAVYPCPLGATPTGRRATAWWFAERLWWVVGLAGVHFQAHEPPAGWWYYLAECDGFSLRLEEVEFDADPQDRVGAAVGWVEALFELARRPGAAARAEGFGVVGIYQHKEADHGQGM